jgi:three-Cys-motif partner protein
MPTLAKQVPWARDPHTAAKHAIYRRYLDRWWPILIRGYSGNATYAEGFAGPGVYDKGESGSPLIALEALLARKELRKLVRRARLLFVDADERCTGLLTRRLQAALGDLPGVTIHDVASMSPEAISGVLQRPGTIIGGFCDSTACLGAFR